MKSKLSGLVPLRAACLAILLVAAGGCVAVVAGTAAGIGAYRYSTGDLEATLDASLDRSARAVERALHDLSFVAIESQHDALVGAAKAKMADDTPVTVDLRKIDDGSTKATIRVGFWGSENKSLEVLRAIKKRL